MHTRLWISNQQNKSTEEGDKSCVDIWCKSPQKLRLQESPEVKDPGPTPWQLQVGFKFWIEELSTNLVPHLTILGLIWCHMKCPHVSTTRFCTSTRGSKSPTGIVLRTRSMMKINKPSRTHFLIMMTQHNGPHQQSGHSATWTLDRTPGTC